MKGVIFIPARGGSNGIRNKNILQVGGRPLIEWSVLHAMYLKSLPQCRDFRTVVSTDSSEIFEVAERVDPEVVRSVRPAHLAENGASLEECVMDYLDREDGEAEGFILLQPTSPIRERKTLDMVAGYLTSCDSIVTVREGNPHIFNYNGNDMGHLERGFGKRYPRQERPEVEKVHYDTGNTYAFSKISLLHHGDRIGGKVNFVGVSLYESLELDDVKELPLIEAAMVALGMVE